MTYRSTEDALRAVDCGIAGMTERQWQVLRLRHLYGLSYSQIGSRLDLTPAAVKMHERHALKKFVPYALKHFD